MCKSLADRLIERLVYGLGGGLIGFCLGGFLGYRFFFMIGVFYFVIAGTAVGFLAGALGGEAGLSWIGSKMRQREEK
jgi:hypothetical protein